MPPPAQATPSARAGAQRGLDRDDLIANADEIAAATTLPVSAEAGERDQGVNGAIIRLATDGIWLADVACIAFPDRDANRADLMQRPA